MVQCSWHDTPPAFSVNLTDRPGHTLLPELEARFCKSAHRSAARRQHHSKKWLCPNPLVLQPCSRDLKHPSCQVEIFIFQYGIVVPLGDAWNVQPRYESSRVRKGLFGFVGFGLAAAILSACGNVTANHPTKDGVVVGRLMISPPMGAIVPTRGTVTFERRGSPHTDVMIDVGDSGRFVAQVPPGIWVVTGRSPKFGNGQYKCESDDAVTVYGKHRVSISVWCVEK